MSLGRHIPLTLASGPTHVDLVDLFKTETHVKVKVDNRSGVGLTALNYPLGTFWLQAPQLVNWTLTVLNVIFMLLLLLLWWLLLVFPMISSLCGLLLISLIKV